jgi:hypothetical protein
VDVGGGVSGTHICMNIATTITIPASENYLLAVAVRLSFSTLLVFFGCSFVIDQQAFSCNPEKITYSAINRE